MIHDRCNNQTMSLNLVQSNTEYMILPKLVQSELANLPFQLKASGQYILFANKSNDISRYQRMDKTVELSFF